MILRNPRVYRTNLKRRSSYSVLRSHFDGEVRAFQSLHENLHLGSCYLFATSWAPMRRRLQSPVRWPPKWPMRTITEKKKKKGRKINMRNTIWSRDCRFKVMSQFI